MQHKEHSARKSNCKQRKKSNYCVLTIYSDPTNLPFDNMETPKNHAKPHEKAKEEEML